MLLLYNISNAKILNSTFKNKTTGCPIDGNRPVIGLWQYTTSTCIQNCTFENNQSIEAIYYSNTCDDTLIEDCTFTNTGGIRGANISDNGPFDGGPALNLSIRNSTFVGGANDFDSPAIQIGAVEGVLIENCHMEEYVIGIIYDNGNDAAGFSIDIIPIHVAVVNTTIENCNNTENLYGIHPGVLYTGGAIGDVNHFYICGKIEETELWPDGDMIHCFSFIGGGEVDHFFNRGMHLLELPPFGEEWHYEDMTTTGANNLNEQCDGASGAPSYCNICTMPNIPITDVLNLINPINPTTASVIEDIYMLSCNQPIVLPVELIRFQGSKQENAIFLNWEIGVADNFNRFEIERLTFENDFEKIGEIEFLGEGKHFQFIDNNPKSGLNYYRLKMIDNDDSFSLSNVVSVNWSDNDKSISINPNPFYDFIQLNLQEEKEASIIIFTPHGQIVDSSTISSSEKTIDTKSLPPGFYFIQINYGRERIIQKLMKTE